MIEEYSANMNKEFLQDYEASESAKLGRYMAEVSKMTEGSEQIPYFDSRIQNANPPLVIADTTTFPLDGQKRDRNDRWV